MASYSQPTVASSSPPTDHNTLSDLPPRHNHDEAPRSRNFDVECEEVDREIPHTRSSVPPLSEEQFWSLVEKELREEGTADRANVRPTKRLWSVLGAVAGGVMGFIAANFPGLVAGAVAGTWLGNVRDKKGRSVYTVFKELPPEKQEQIRRKVAVFATAISKPKALNARGQRESFS